MIYFHEHTDSTNRIAKEMAEEGAPAGTVVVAASQSAGRGQYGRSFNSPLGGLYFSVVVEPDLPLERVPLVTLAAGLACRNVLHANFRVNPAIKWPNDLFLGRKKVAGILCEHLSRHQQSSKGARVVIGVGLNVNSRIEQFDPEVQALVTTLFEHLGREVDIHQLLNDLLQAIASGVERLAVDCLALLEEWQQYDLLRNNSVTYKNQNSNIEGIGQGITPDGLYRITDHTGQKHTIVGGQLRLSTC